MARVKTSDLAVLLEDIRKQLADLTGRVERIERGGAPAESQAAAALPPPPPGPEAPGPEITEEELLAISGAIAAYMGVRVRVRQIRLLSSRAWAQEGRVSIQASHRLHS